MIGYEARTHYRNPAVAAGYDAQFHRLRGWSDARARLLGALEVRAFDSLLASMEPGLVLDIACGTGRYVQRLRCAGHRVVGSDVSGEMLAVARGRNGRRPEISGFQQGDAARLPYADGTFDGVTCMRLYHRIEPALRVTMMREVRRVGRGWAILFFGMTNPWLGIRRRLRAVFGGRPTNPQAITLAALEAELDDAGLALRDRRWVLPGLADGLVVRVSW